MMQQVCRGILVVCGIALTGISGAGCQSSGSGTVTDRQNSGSGTGFANSRNPATVERPAGGENVGGSDDIAPDAANNVCTRAIAHITNDCSGTAATYRFHDSCDVYDACEATCYETVPCGALTADNTTDSQAKALNTCVTACYAEGIHTCEQAESKVMCCGYDLTSSWNRDGFCDAEERCVSNCVLGSDKCSSLLDENKTGSGKNYWDCADRCVAASLRHGPLVYDAAYCAQYPNDVHCNSTAAPQPAPGTLDRYCLVYPDATACQNPTTFCTAHPRDTWCGSSEYACSLDHFSEGCLFEPSYCWEHAHSEVLCSTPRGAVCDTAPVDGCAGACAQAATSFGTSFLMCALCLCQNPAYANLCHGGSGSNTTSDFCYENPSAPECGICANYPRSRECEEGNYDEYNNDYNN